MDYINPNNQKRLNCIWELHNNGFSKRGICNFFILNGFQRRNKKDNYSIKDVFLCLKKLEVRNKRKTDIRVNIGLWKCFKK